MSEMIENNELPEQPSQPPAPEQELPGKRLRQARESRGFSREDVAAQLRLQVRHITALEEDDYAALPGPTFTTGYLRSYARLLELPVDSLVAPLQAQQPSLVSTSASVREISSRSGIARLATYLIIGAIIVSVALWWTGRQERLELPNSLSESAPLSAQTEVVSSAEETAALTESTAETESAVDGELVGETAAEEPSAAAADSEEVAPAPVPAPAPTPAVTAARAVSQPPEPPPLSPEMPQSKLELRFEADSWTEVKDNAGRQLLYRLIKVGEVVVLRGEAPFHVFLGYAPGVTVYYNDELFDHAAFQRRDVARFRLGRAEHNHPLSSR
jgi:cytoskeleton protein RodZ